MSVDKDLVNWLANFMDEDPEMIDVQIIPFTSSNSPGLLNESKGPLATHRCRNRVYRRGVTARCGRLATEAVCQPCKKAISNKKSQLLGEKKLSADERKEAKKALPEKDAYPIPDQEHARNALSRAKQFASPEDQKTITRNVKKEFPGMDVDMEATKPTVKLGPTSKNEGFMRSLELALFEGKKEPSNKPDDDKFDTEFKTQCDEGDCDNHKPQDPRHRTSSLTDGPSGAKQTGKAYLESRQICEDKCARCGGPAAPNGGAQWAKDPETGSPQVVCSSCKRDPRARGAKQASPRAQMLAKHQTKYGI